MITNDIYTYDKELEEFKTLGAALINGVYVVEQLLSVPPDAAKRVVHEIIRDIELELYQLCQEHLQSGQCNDRQRTYIMGLVYATSGNIFFSATLGRYLGHAEERFPCKVI